MTQVLTDRATLEQLVVALNNAEDALNNSQALIAGRERFGFAKTCYAANEIALGFVSPAITAGRAALANAEPTWWQKIETAPKDYVTEFDGWNGDRVPNVSWAHPEYSSKGHYAWCVSEYEHHNGWVNTEVKGLTHWMPLPPSPGDTP